ncbi:MAG: cadherin-like beta sandwich domain-containing protein [Ruminococcaceae bacterium]|nr:cadherin-like beta sandwich domain-containing protein [Oscillospiraceae bacterium]
MRIMMKLKYRVIAGLLAVITCFSVLTVSVSAKKFAKNIDTNVGFLTQYAYEENDPSWLRQLYVKENMLSVEGIVTEKPLHPVAAYPYRTDAPCFAEEVNEYAEIYTLDEESQKAAYIYVFQQIGALSIIGDPDATGQSKAAWLREQGIIITPEEEEDPDSIFMISALYALWKNDFYYVFTGERITIPPGTKLQAALMTYMMALDGDDRPLLAFLNKYFDITSIVSLEDYIYYTCLFALYTSGYVSSRELVSISRKETYRRLSIMTISNAGISVDANSATDEEIQIKYMAAMLGIQYDITLDPDSTFKANRAKTLPYYMIQRMAYEDKGIAISSAKYTYEQAFDIVLKKTNRFDLEKEFYSDIYEYNVYLDYFRDLIYIDPTPVDYAHLTIKINNKIVTPSKYEKVSLTKDDKQVITITVQYNGKPQKTTTYKLNVFQGMENAPADENITGIVSNIGNNIVPNLNNNATSPSYDYLNPTLDAGAVPNPTPQVLHINEFGQLVDSQGNVISDTVSESLPEGYGYILNPNGVVTIGKLDSVTTTTADSVASGVNKDEIKTIVIYFSIFLVAAAMVAGFIYYRLTVKKRRTKSVKKASNKKQKKTAKKKK